jgi:hypothetical protein
MKAYFSKFLYKNLIVAMILAIIGTILFCTVLHAFFHPVFPILLLLAFIINVILFYIVTRKEVSDNQLLNLVIKSFLIKFFSYLSIVLIFLILEKTRTIRITFVVVLFILYFGFTWIEIQSLLKFLKTGKKK